jgi:Localisation of periplasmic protein complexes.
MRIRALVAIVGLLLTTVTVDALAVTQVKSMRLWRAPDNTRLVFDLSGPVQHSVFTLSAPDRLVIDINGATLAAPLNVATSNTPISSVRSAQRTPTDLRVVVDLKKSVTPKSFTLAPNAQYGNRWWSTCTTRRLTPSRPARRLRPRLRHQRLQPRQQYR